ncbi:Alginate export [Lutibacter agarilyticus]|uniref:Alginate export n=1 Tax=Lutibacter agarilyticus TaxID=1109740 RepID=A0A238W3E4_9FLAO|nr:alginate export family protein [Lutibacter agarilyticus]SNR41028.1 Alginate export [Lutibacter agarilyticus]
MKTKHLLLLIVVLVSSKMVAQFTLSGEFRPRTEFRNGFKTLRPNDADPALFTSQRVRLNTKFATETYTFYVSIQDIRVWGDVKQLNTADKNGLAIHEAWGLVNFEGMSLKAGRQEIVYDDHRMFGNVGWAQQARSHDALLLSFGKSFKLDVGLAFNQDGEALFDNTYTTAGSYKAMQYAWFNKKWDNFALSLLFLNNGLQYIDVVDSANNEIRYSQTLGSHLKYKITDNLNAVANLYYQAGNDVAKRDVNAFLVGLDLGYKASNTWSFGLGFEMQSGNDFDGDASKNKAFSPFYGTNHKFNGFMDYFYVGNHFNSTGLIDVFGKISANLGEKSNLSLFIHNFTSYAEVANGVEKQLGTELDLVYGYKLSKDISLAAGYSQMFASEGMEYLKNNFDGNSNNWAWLMLTIKPTLFSN